MRRILLFFGAIAAVAGAVYFWHSPPPLQKLDDEAVVVAFGDSLTAGFGAQKSYPEFLADDLGREIINAGIYGETSRAALKRLPKVLAEHKPDLLIVCIGGNDFLRGYETAETESNLRAIVRAGKEAGAAVVLVAVPLPLLLPVNSPVYGRVARGEKLWLEDKILKTILHNNRLKSDYVHPNEAGYKELAAAVAALLRRAGAV